jgi:hypothetical protein
VGNIELVVRDHVEMLRRGVGDGVPGGERQRPGKVHATEKQPAVPKDVDYGSSGFAH